MLGNAGRNVYNISRMYSISRNFASISDNNLLRNLKSDSLSHVKYKTQNTENGHQNIGNGAQSFTRIRVNDMELQNSSRVKNNEGENSKMGFDDIYARSFVLCTLCGTIMGITGHVTNHGEFKDAIEYVAVGTFVGACVGFVSPIVIPLVAIGGFAHALSYLSR